MCEQTEVQQHFKATKRVYNLQAGESVIQKPRETLETGDTVRGTTYSPEVYWTLLCDVYVHMVLIITLFQYSSIVAFWWSGSSLRLP